MKRLFLAMAIICAVACSTPKSELTADVAIIPQPLSLVQHENSFTITPATVLVCDEEALMPIIDYTREYIAVQGVEKIAPSSG